jgi:transcriptional regulator with XRE-family HTH domain
MVIVEMRVSLTEALIAARKKAKLTQAEVAKRIQSSQSRIAKMEGGDSQTSLELLVRAITAVGSEVVLTVKPSTGAVLARKLREMRQKPRETKRAATGGRTGIARHA